MGLSVVRDERGRLPKGAVINPSGKNQWSNPRNEINDRIDKRMQSVLAKNAFCVESFCESIVLALADPHEPNNRELLKLALPRLWPVVLTIESASGKDLRDLESGSDQEWLRFAENFGAPIPGLAGQDTAGVFDVEPVTSSDTSPGTE